MQIFSFTTVGLITLLIVGGCAIAQVARPSTSPGTPVAHAARPWTGQTVSRAYLNSRNLPASGVALDGFSPVSYFTAGRAEPGSARFAVEHDGVTYHLTSPEQMRQFRAQPDRFVPAYGGWCAFGMAVEDKFPVDPTQFKIVEGRLLVFLHNANINARDLWNKGDDQELTAKAQAHWSTVSGG